MNDLFQTIESICKSLSEYSPIIICISILVFSIFTSVIEKALFFFLWIFVITFIRIIIFKGFPNIISTPVNQACNLTNIFINNDVGYSIFILSFTMMYIIMPMILASSQNQINIINYGIIAFFIVYICLDLFIKKRQQCYDNILTSVVIGNLISGVFLGCLIAGVIMYGTLLKNYLYINDMNSNKEVCSMASKQQFKCKVYKNGVLIGTQNE